MGIVAPNFEYCADLVARAHARRSATDGFATHYRIFEFVTSQKHEARSVPLLANPLVSERNLLTSDPL